MQTSDISNHIQAAALAVQQSVRVIPTAIALANFSQHGLTVARARAILAETPVLSAAVERCALELAASVSTSTKLSSPATC